MPILTLGRGRKCGRFCSEVSRQLGPGNVISGARSYNNADDGFDFWEAENGVTVINSWSFHNGMASVFNNPSGFQGDGNGIKLGHDSGTHVLGKHAGLGQSGQWRRREWECDGH